MEEALIKRVLPHSVEAEQSVIGAMLMDCLLYTSCEKESARTSGFMEPNETSGSERFKISGFSSV